MKKYFLLIVLLVGIMSIGGIFLTQKTVKDSLIVPTLTPIPTPGLPMQLTVPSLHLTAHIESVGMDSQGRMDVPKNALDTAWYNLGVRPGQQGNAVVDGHLDMVTGAPAVFWNLSKLKPGDIVVVQDQNSNAYRYSITKMISYPDASFPLQEVFGTTNKSRLNLITCAGTWDRLRKNYSNRIVVYAELQQ